MKKPQGTDFSIHEAFAFGGYLLSIFFLAGLSVRLFSPSRLFGFELSRKGIPKLLSSYYKSKRLSIRSIKLTILTCNCRCLSNHPGLSIAPSGLPPGAASRSSLGLSGPMPGYLRDVGLSLIGAHIAALRRRSCESVIFPRCKGQPPMIPT